MSVSPIPEGFHSLTPLLVVDDGEKAITFYETAFGAQLLNKANYPGTNKIMNAQMKIGNSIFMLCDEMPGRDILGPNEVGNTTVMVHFYSEDATASWNKAMEAGVEVIMPLDMTFWGDRYGTLRDPFGHIWSIASHVEEVSPEEISEGAAKAYEHASLK